METARRREASVRSAAKARAVRVVLANPGNAANPADRAETDNGRRRRR